MKNRRGEENDQVTPRSEMAGPRAVASFCWVDSESHEELQVDVRGCEVFFEELVKLGFKRLDGRDIAAAEGHPRRRAAVDATPVKQEQRARRGA